MLVELLNLCCAGTPSPMMKDLPSLCSIVRIILPVLERARPRRVRNRSELIYSKVSESIYYSALWSFYMSSISALLLHRTKYLRVMIISSSKILSISSIMLGKIFEIG